MLALSLTLFAFGLTPAPFDEAERRAVAYLEAEVPRWSVENHCTSCHNNGDGARALYRAIRAGVSIRPDALAATGAWLARPGEWEAAGKPAGGSSDPVLARVEFTLALAASVEVGRKSARPALVEAADRLARDQEADGSWPVEDGGSIGGPATYGRPLATGLAVKTLREADPKRHAVVIDRGMAYLRVRPAMNVVESAALLMAEPMTIRTEAGRRARRFLLDATAKEGGWGPYRISATEPFDTALALIALAPERADPEVAAALDRGRAALVASQLADGSWPETTRPAGGESYAERVSTAGWATIALFDARK